MSVTAQEIQTPGSEAAKVGAEVLAGESGGAHESKRALDDLGKEEAGSLEAVPEGSDSSVEVMTPPKQSSTGNVAAPSLSSAAPKEEVRGESTRSEMEGGSCAPDAGQFPGTRMDSWSSGSSQKLPSTEQRASLSSRLSPGTGEPTSKAVIPGAGHPRITSVFLLSCSSVSQSDVIMVCFHAILSKDFKVNPEVHKVFIRGQGISSYVNWKDNICELNCTKRLEEHGYLIEGAVALAKENMDKCIPYKYLVSCGEEEYEFIYKAPSFTNYVNRCLFIKSNLVSNGEWHQYDDIVCKSSLMKNVQKMFSFDKKKDVVKGKTIAANIMLENIFSILGTWSLNNLRSFLCQLKQFYVVTKDPRVYDGREIRWTELNFGTQQVSCFLLTDTGKQAFTSQEDTVIKSKLALGLTILTVVEELQLMASKSTLAEVCNLLCLDKESHDLSIHLTNLCQKCIDDQVDQWVWVLPLLHFLDAPLRREHLPMEEDTWAGLEGLCFAERRQKGTLLQLMKDKKYLMEFDKTLVKSWMCVLPLESLAEFIQCFSSDLLVTLQGVSYRLENNLVGLFFYPFFFSLPPNFLPSEQRKNSSSLFLSFRALEAGCWQSCLTCCFKIHKRVCKCLKLGKWYTIPANSATMVSKVAKLQSPAVSTKELFTDREGRGMIPNTDAFLPSVCLVQTQSNLLEKIPSYNMSQLSQLVSMIIVKSWPMKNRQPEDDFDKILHHVLTWPDIKRIFSFNGMSG
uniref:Uncharacterized protein n=1 Tax=Calidris pygmaea TaxID=425635 RepID=A0A8C3KDY2_9CHAR